MSDAVVLNYLREQFARVHSRLDVIHGDLTDVAVRMGALATEAGHMRIGMAELNSRLERLDARFERIERRLN